MQRVLVITGTPGVGKSSVSGFLVSRLGGVHVNLSDLVKEEKLSWGVDRERKTLIVDENRTSKRVGEIIRQSEGYVIIDGHFAVDIVAVENVLLAFVLRRNPDELMDVLRERGFSKTKVMENVGAEILDVCLFDAVKAYGKKKICEVDVSGRTVEDVAEEITSIVKGRKKCRTGVVDWLTKLEFEGRLDEFLASF